VRGNQGIENRRGEATRKESRFEKPP
jgi:hypothetical protein